LLNWHQQQAPSAGGNQSWLYTYQAVGNEGSTVTNTRIRLLTRRAFGFHSAEPLIALAMLSLGGHRPLLPGRPA
jgi:hypothetical protein